jgi:hypothetical protein
MLVRRHWMRGAIAPFILTFLLTALMPVRIGLQDLSSLISRLPGVAERAREHLIASPFGTIHAATFSFPMLSGAAATDAIGYRLASLNTRDPDGAESFAARNFFDAADAGPPRAFPQVNRTGKGDRLVPRVRDGADSQDLQAEPQSGPQAETPASVTGFSLASVSAATVDLTSALPATSGVPVFPARPSIAEEAEAALADPDHAESDAGLAELDMLGDDEHPTVRAARIYFDTAPLGSGMQAVLQPWAPGEAPVLDMPPAAFTPPTPKSDSRPAIVAALPPAAGETIASKGEVTGADKRPMTPSERLKLTAASRPKQEKCLADAIYFESRGENARGQIAVAQVVMNRVFSGYYPDSVCGVVYQNSHRHLACQFTFACDGKADRVTEPEAWTRAKTIAKDTLDGKYWLNDVGKATHYHAYWVHPWWVRTMHKLDRIGVHTFYRPRNWGDGADQPKWGDAAATLEAAKKL